MNTKSLRVEVKDAVKGEVTCHFARYNVKDHDGDVTLPGAFEDGAEVTGSAYGHKSWEGEKPVALGTIYTVGDEVAADLQFFMDTIDGAETFKTVKNMKHRQEWSYGFDILEYSYGEFEGEQVRFLKKLRVHEVSPVLLGAGIGTRTTSVKGFKTDQHKKNGFVPAHDSTVMEKAWDGFAVVKAVADDARPSELRTVYAWVDPEGDPELKTSYAFAHHHGVGGPTNLRACLMGIAELNGTKGARLSDADRKGVYEHLAAHVRDADREPPELQSPGDAKKFNDELLEGLAALSSLVDSASRVVAQRAEKGKQLSKVNAEVLEWISDELKRLEPLYATPVAGTVPEDELQSLFLASMARVHDLEGVTER